MLDWLSNSALRRTVIGFCLSALVMAALGYGFAHSMAFGMEQRALKRDAALLGRALSLGVDEGALTEVYTRGSTPSEAAAGEAMFSSVGLSSPMSRPDANPLSGNWPYISAGLAAGATLLMGLLSSAIIMHMLVKLRHMTAATWAMAEGDASRVDTPEDGELSRLGYALETLGGRVSYQLASLTQERAQLQEMLSNISHQLKTRIATFALYIDLLGEGGGERHQANLKQRALDEAGRMDWLVQRMLAMARLEAGAVQMDKRLLPLLHTVEQAASTLRMAIQQKEQLLTLSVSEHLVFPHDAGWMAEAVANILKNAVEHTPRGGTIIISADETPLTLELTIADTGEGIAPDELPYLFRRFFRAKTGLKPDSVGIGLPMAREIIKQHDGDITVTSKLGEGATFVLTFIKPRPDAR